MTRRRLEDLPRPQQAGILANQDTFQRYAAVRNGFPGGQFSAQAAAEHIRAVCQVTSRRDLDDNAEAAGRFDRLRTDYDAWRGRIAPQPERTMT